MLSGSGLLRIQVSAKRVSKMNLYKRTAAGNAAALNPRLPLSPKLRALLVSVDGHTLVETYVKNLASLGDVMALLNSLLMQGYLEIISTDNFAPVANPAQTIRQNAVTPALEHQSQVGMASADLESAFKLAGITNTSAPPAKESFSNSVQPESRFQNSTVSAAASSLFTAPATRPGAPLGQAQYQLRGAISLMSDFVTAHLPAESIEIVLTLERLSSVEQVLASLNDYKRMITPAGSAVAPHLDELRALLSSR